MAKKGTDLAYWMHGAFMLEAGAKLTEVKGKLARMGYAEQRAFYKVQAREGREPRGYVSQDPEDKRVDSIEELARQNGFAAALWKAHAEEAEAKLKAQQFTDRERAILSYLVECLATGAEELRLEGEQVSELEAWRLLYKLS